MRRGFLLGLIFSPAAIVALVQWVAIHQNSDFQTWLEAGAPGRVPLVGVLALYGPIMPLALLGAWRVRRGRDTRLYPVVVWLALQLVLLQLPLDVSSRYAEGLYVPVATLAAVGWFRGVAPWLAQHAPRRVAKAALPVVFASVAVSAIFLLTMMLVRIMDRGHPDYYISADEHAAMSWLDDVATLDDTVLSEENVGNRIPAQAGVHVLVGHGYETLDHDTRADEVAQFFNVDTSDSARIDYLRQFGIDYVYFSPAERALGEFDPSMTTYLIPGFAHGSVTVYLVQLPSDSPD